jgi:hypothetical protein
MRSLLLALVLLGMSLLVVLLEIISISHSLAATVLPSVLVAGCQPCGNCTCTEGYNLAYDCTNTNLTTIPSCLPETTNFLCACLPQSV